MSLESNDDYTRALVDYGLSNAQAKIYLAMLTLGPASIREISQVSKVARPDNYRAIKELENIGLVEKIITVPTKYNPVNISEAFEILNMRRKKEYADLVMRSNQLVKTFEERKSSKASNSNGEHGQFVLIHGIESIERKLQSAVENAQDSISVMVPWNRLQQWSTNNFEILEKALLRNVHMRVITEQPDSKNVSKEYRTLKANPNFDARHVGGDINIWLRIYDGNEVILTSPESSSPSEWFAVLVKNASITEIAQNYFNFSWFSAVKLPKEALTGTRNFDSLFASMSKGFSFNKMLFDADSKPVDFVILETNSAFEEITGIDRPASGKRATKALSGLGSSLTEMIEIFGRAVATHKTITYECHFPTSAKTFSVLVYSPESGYFATLFEDITELKNIQDALKEIEEKYQYVAKYVSAAVYEIDCKNLRFIDMNEYMHNATGYSKEELLSLSPYDLLDDKSKELFQEIIRKSWKGEKIDENVEFTILAKDGRKRHALLNSKLTYKGQELDRALVVAQDITDRKRLGDALKNMEDGYRALFTCISEGFAYCRMVFDEEGKPVDFVFLEINSSFEKSMGLTKEVVVGKKATELIPGIEKSNPELFETLCRISLSRKCETFEFFLGPINRWLSISAHSPEKGYVGLVIEDVTNKHT